MGLYTTSLAVRKGTINEVDEETIKNLLQEQGGF
jgi:hypothetical protein